MQSGCSNSSDVSMKAGELAQALTALMDTNQPSAASFDASCQSLDTSLRFYSVLPGNPAEKSPIVREALRINLPHHLVFRAVQNQIRTHGSTYSSLNDLVADLFDPSGVSSPENQEVPMETDQLEEAMMMSSSVVKKALRAGVPPHLIKPPLRAKILSSGAGYADVQELIADMNKS